MQQDIAIRPGSAPAWLGYLRRELLLAWRFNRYDLSTTIYPGTIFTFAAWHANGGSSRPLIPSLLNAIVYFFLFIYCFTLSNQLTGIEEDRLNKPDRPLPSGLITPRGALVRWYIAMAIFTAYGWYHGVLLWTLMWQISLTLHNMAHFARHWTTKNTCMAFGTLAMLAGAWSMVRPITNESMLWIVLPACIMFTHANIQDVRDIPGDRANGRRTFPIVFGWSFTRWYLVACFGLMPLLIHFVLIAPHGLSWPALACDGVLASLCAMIVVRLLRYNKSEDHQQTYMLFTYWYCALLASAIIVL